MTAEKQYEQYPGEVPWWVDAAAVGLLVAAAYLERWRRQLRG